MFLCLPSGTRNFQFLLSKSILFNSLVYNVGCCWSWMRVPRKLSKAAKREVEETEAEHQPIWLIAGLGNPGCLYEGTRHNVGFDVVSHLAASEGITFQPSKGALLGKGVICGTPVLLAKPQTFMNCSGDPLLRLMKLHKIPKENLVVLLDDLDLQVAQLRLKGQGGSGGHNGMKSIIQGLGGSNKFARLRIGIDRPKGLTPVAMHVLLKFSKEEQEKIDKVIPEASDVVKQIISNGVDRTMSKVNTAYKSK